MVTVIHQMCLLQIFLLDVFQFFHQRLFPVAGFCLGSLPPSIWSSRLLRFFWSVTILQSFLGFSVLTLLKSIGWLFGKVPYFGPRSCFLMAKARLLNFAGLSQSDSVLLRMCVRRPCCWGDLNLGSGGSALGAPVVLCSQRVTDVPVAVLCAISLPLTDGAAGFRGGVCLVSSPV